MDRAWDTLGRQRRRLPPDIGEACQGKTPCWRQRDGETELPADCFCICCVQIAGSVIAHVMNSQHEVFSLKPAELPHDSRLELAGSCRGVLLLRVAGR